MTTGRGKGLRRSTPTRVAHRLGATRHPAIGSALAATPSGGADLRAFWPTPFDQGATSTCHAHSASMLSVVAGAAAGKPLSMVPSPLLIASCTYADVRAAVTPVGQPLPPLSDPGAELQDDADAIARWGLAPIGPSVDGRYSDVPDDVAGIAFPEPIVAQLSRAVRMAGEYAIAVDSDAPRIVAASLDARIPVWAGGLVGAIFEGDTDPNISVGPDATGAGHAMGVLAYRTAAGGSATSGPWEFFLESSWGAGFGLNGGRWVNQAWITAQWDLWPFTIAVPS